MKKISLTLSIVAIAIFAVAFLSCKKDQQATQIVGRWYVTGVITSETVNGVERKDTLVNTDRYDYYEFNANGMALIRQSDTEENISWRVSNNQLILGINTAYGKAQTFDINTLTDNTLQLHRFDIETDWTTDQTITLTKAGSN
jgi:hypothetical protein